MLDYILQQQRWGSARWQSDTGVPFVPCLRSVQFTSKVTYVYNLITMSRTWLQIIL